MLNFDTLSDRGGNALGLFSGVLLSIFYRYAVNSHLSSESSPYTRFALYRAVGGCQRCIFRYIVQFTVVVAFLSKDSSAASRQGECRIVPYSYSVGIHIYGYVERYVDVLGNIECQCYLRVSCGSSVHTELDV